MTPIHKSMFPPGSLGRALCEQREANARLNPVFQQILAPMTAKTMKVLRITMPDGSEWEVPASIIAKHRASYYGEKEGPEVAKAEYAHTMKSNDELLDWAPNNMDWSDVKQHAKMVLPPNPLECDFQEGWLNGDREIREVPE